MSRTIALWLIVVLLLAGFVPGGSVGLTETNVTEDASESAVLVRNFTSTYGVEHTATLDTTNDTIVVESYNPTNETEEFAGYVVHVEDERYDTVDQSLEPDERTREQWTFNDTMAITRTNHSVSVHGWGENASARFNYTKEIGTDNPERYPVPEIVDAELVDSASRNRSGLFLAVTLRNEANRTYKTAIYVHTNQTQGERVPTFVPQETDARTVYVPLEDDPFEPIQGEVRLYRGTVKNDSGIRDQIYFEGTLDGDTDIENESFEPITPPYEDDAYEFDDGEKEPESDERSLGDRILPATAMAVLVVVGATILLGLLFRLR